MPLSKSVHATVRTVARTAATFLFLLLLLAPNLLSMKKGGGTIVGVGVFVHALVGYDPNTPTVVSNLGAKMTRLLSVDTTFDTNVDVLVGTGIGLISIRRKKPPTTPTIAFDQRIIYNQTYVKGNVEAMAFFTQPSSVRGAPPTGVIVTANSRDPQFPKNFPKGAIELVREPSTKGRPPTVTTLVSATTPLKGPTMTMTEINGRDVQALDMNKDGFVDIVATVNGKSSSSNSVGSLLYLKNDGKNNFPTVTVLAENLNGRAIFDIGDCDQNGLLDIAVLGVDSKVLTVFYQETNGSFSPVVIESNLSSNLAITVGFFNSDTGADIFTLGSDSATAYLPVPNSNPEYGTYRAFSRNRFFYFDVSQHLSSDYRDWQIALHDVDADGLMDIVLMYGKQTGLKWMKQLPDKRVTGPTNLLPTVGGPSSFNIVDMNNDGIPDIVIHSDLSDKIFLYLGKTV